MTTAYDKLVQHFDEHDVHYREMTETQSILIDNNGEVGLYRFIVSVEEDEDLMQVYCYAPIRVPEGSRPSIAEAITRANHGMKLGKFEMDYDDGELRFQTAHKLPCGVLDDETIMRMFGMSMTLMDLYLPAFLSVIYGNELAQDAIQVVEHAMQNDA